MPNGHMNDHDMLVSLQTKIVNLCSTISELKADIKEIKNREMPCAGQFEKCNQVFREIDKRLDRRSKWGSLVTVLVLLISLVTGIIGYNFSIDARQFELINRTNELVIRNQEAVDHYHNTHGN